MPQTHTHAANKGSQREAELCPTRPQMKCINKACSGNSLSRTISLSLTLCSLSLPLSVFFSHFPLILSLSPAAVRSFVAQSKAQTVAAPAT